MLATAEVRRVGPYEIGAEIGRGSTSRVFAAQHLGMARRVAFKELHVGADREAGERFRSEARITASISHPHVVPAHDYVEHEGGAALVLEHAPHGPLRKHIRRGLGLGQVGGVLEDVLSGLAQLESQQILHLDIKPDNLLVMENGRIKIADFGTARSVRLGVVDAPDQEEGIVVGTPQYLAPERVRCGHVGPWTDLYAVGMLTFEMLVGRSPFSGTQDPVDVIQHQLHDPVPRVCDLLPGMSHQVADWIGWLVAKSPAQRPRGATEAWDGLDQVLNDVLGPSWRLSSGL